jgi:hypothetical protein
LVLLARKDDVMLVPFLFGLGVGFLASTVIWWYIEYGEE